MGPSDTTCWTLIQEAAAGGAPERETFARRYLPVVRAYLGARWQKGAFLEEIDDAAQEVFVECFRSGGPLSRAERERPGGFRPFLYGIVRNVARRFEHRRTVEWARQPAGEVGLAQVEADETSLSKVFDRAWARTILREAAERQAEQARLAGPEAQRRVEILRLRFHENLPIREIATRWEVDAAHLHHEYARARKEFKAALQEVVAFHLPNAPPAEVEKECAALLRVFG